MNGHPVGCSLPYQPELNPTELMWENVRNGVATEYKTLHLDDILHVTREIFVSITA